jgi:hypothetical protein
VRLRYFVKFAQALNRKQDILVLLMIRLRVLSRIPVAPTSSVTTGSVLMSRSITAKRKEVN